MKGEKVEKNRRLILSCLIQYASTGRSVGELEKDTGLSHETITDHMKYLIDEGYAYDRPNKFGKYRWTGKPLGDPSPYSYLFANKIMENIGDWKLVASNNKFCNKKKMQDQFGLDEGKRKELNVLREKAIQAKNANIYQKQQHVTSRKEKEERIIADEGLAVIKRKIADLNRPRDEVWLFGFSNLIAAIIMYFFIQAVKPSQKTFGIDGAIGLKERSLSGGDKNILALRLIENTIPLLLNKFRESPMMKRFFESKYIDDWIGRPTIENNDVNEDIDEADYNRSHYEITDEENFKRLTNAYRSIYPDLFEELEKIRNTIPDEIDQRRDQIHELRRRDSSRQLLSSHRRCPKCNRLTIINKKRI